MILKVTIKNADTGYVVEKSFVGVVKATRLFMFKDLLSALEFVSGLYGEDDDSVENDDSGK